MTYIAKLFQWNIEHYFILQRSHWPVLNSSWITLLFIDLELRSIFENWNSSRESIFNRRVFRELVILIPPHRLHRSFF
jgi:hypothetical protein